MIDEPRDLAGERVDPAGEAAQRLQHRLMLEFGSREEWGDPRLEWRRLFSELFGTFLLVLVAAGGGLLHAQGQISLASAVVAPGLMVMAIILFMGAVSGAHLNPAVSLAFAMRRDFPWRRVPGYIVVQLLGATLASLFLLAVFGDVGHLGATLPGPGYENWQALLMEVALTAGLVSVILGTASAAQNVGPIAALGVGGYIALAGLWAAPVSGVSMNPARSFGPALVERRLHELLGLRGRAVRGGADRSRVRLHSARARGDRYLARRWIRRPRRPGAARRSPGSPQTSTRVAVCRRGSPNPRRQASHKASIGSGTLIARAPSSSVGGGVAALGASTCPRSRGSWVTPGYRPKLSFSTTSWRSQPFFTMPASTRS